MCEVRPLLHLSEVWPLLPSISDPLTPCNSGACAGYTCLASFFPDSENCILDSVSAMCLSPASLSLSFFSIFAGSTLKNWEAPH